MDWYWARFRDHYFNAGATVAVLFIGVFVLIPTGELFAQAWKVSAKGGVVFGFTTFLISIAAAFYGANSIPTFRKPIEAWIAGDHSDPLHVRDSALVSAERAAAQGLKVALPLGAAIVAPMLVNFGHLGWRGLVIVELMIAMSFAISMFLVGIACTLLARPLLEEIAAELKVNQPPRDASVVGQAAPLRGASVRRRWCRDSAPAASPICSAPRSRRDSWPASSRALPWRCIAARCSTSGWRSRR